MRELDKEYTGLYLKGAITELKKHLDSSALMCISILLSMMSVILGNKVHTYNGPRQRLNANLWMMLIAQSGMGGKSTTIKAISEMILEPIMNETHKKYKTELEAYKALSKDEKAETNPPSFIKPLSGQGSNFQGMIKSLEKNNHGMLAVYDEAGEFLKKFSRDTEHKSALTSLYDQKYYGKDLVGSGSGESIFIEDPFLSILAVTNPHSLIDETTETDYVSGYFNRFSIVEIQEFKRPQPFKTKEVPNFEKFQNVALEVWNEIQKNYTRENPLILATDEIEEEYSIWYNQQFDKYENDSEAMTSFLMRQVTSALKYAMIIQIFDGTLNKKPIDENKTLKIEYMRIGFYLAEVYIEAFKEHIDNIGLNESDGYAKTKKVNEVKKLAEKINTYLTKEDKLDYQVTRSNMTNNIRGLSAKNFDEAMDYALNKYEYIKVENKMLGKIENTYYTAISQTTNPKLDNFIDWSTNEDEESYCDISMLVDNDEVA